MNEPCTDSHHLSVALSDSDSGCASGLALSNDHLGAATMLRRGGLSGRDGGVLMKRVAEFTLALLE